jgi:hypothetical protein
MSWLSNVDPDPDWISRATAIKKRREESARVAQTIPVLPLQVRKDDEGLYWISSHAVIRLGVSRRLQPDDVIEIPTHDAEPVEHQPCDCLWEVQAYRESTREYWVRPLRVPDYVPEG